MITNIDLFISEDSTNCLFTFSALKATVPLSPRALSSAACGRSEEEADDFSSRVLATRFLVRHDAIRCRENKMTEPHRTLINKVPSKTN